MKRKKGLIGSTELPVKIELVKKFMSGDKDYMIQDGYESGFGDTLIRTFTIWWEEHE